MTAPGYFIVFEGGDGAGKSTQVPLLAAWLREVSDREVLTVREPGGTELGAQIRAMVLHGGHVAPRAEALLYAADRAHHVAEVIAPALAEGAVVVGDRFVDSSIAYQALGRDLAEADVRAINDFATQGLRPDLVVLLDVDVSTGLGRLGGQEDRLERAGVDFHARVRAYYLAAAAADPARYRVVDAAGPPEQVAARVRAVVADAMGIRVAGPAVGGPGHPVRAAGRP